MITVRICFEQNVGDVWFWPIENYITAYDDVVGITNSAVKHELCFAEFCLRLQIREQLLGGVPAFLVAAVQFHFVTSRCDGKLYIGATQDKYSAQQKSTMIHHEVQVSILRMFADDDAVVGEDPYDAIMTLVWLDEHTVYAKGLHGKLTRRVASELARKLIAMGVKVVKAHRAEGHSLPGAVCVGENEYELDLQALAARLKLDRAL